MKYIYNFKNHTDIIVKKTLKKSDFKNIVEKIRELNSQYDYRIYLVGSYLNYLQNPLDYYNDIDFIITSKKIMDLDVLSSFMYKFHDLCKLNKIAYDLMYLIDAAEEDLNTNPQIPAILSVDESRIITAYKSKYPQNLSPKQFIQMKEHHGSDLFEGLLNTDVGVKLIARRSDFKDRYPLPIKIT